jgi:hypothetical protein
MFSGEVLRDVRQLQSELASDAPPERVWAVLTDFPAYPEWIPFIRRISGELGEGAKLEGQIQSPGARATTFRPRVRAVETNRELRWLGRLLVLGIFDGEHRFVIEPREATATSLCRSVSVASSSGSSRARSRRPRSVSSR